LIESDLKCLLVSRQVYGRIQRKVHVFPCEQTGVWSPSEESSWIVEVVGVLIKLIMLEFEEGTRTRITCPTCRWDESFTNVLLNYLIHQRSLHDFPRPLNCVLLSVWCQESRMLLSFSFWTKYFLALWFVRRLFVSNFPFSFIVLTIEANCLHPTLWRINHRSLSDLVKGVVRVAISQQISGKDLLYFCSFGIQIFLDLLHEYRLYFYRF
jgi:hypothetical protein